MGTAVFAGMIALTFSGAEGLATPAGVANLTHTNIDQRRRLGPAQPTGRRAVDAQRPRPATMPPRPVLAARHPTDS